jgi:prepilin-type N-terminal cleavage/methylation domain-containing protein
MNCTQKVQMVKDQKLMYGSNTHRAGFSLLEVLVVIALIGIMSAILLPSFSRKTARQEREAFIAAINKIVHTGWQEAVRNHTIYQVTFDIQARRMTLLNQEILDEESAFEWPEQYEIKQVYIEGYLEKNSKKFWFFIMPEGMAQNVIINCYDTKDVQDFNPRPFSLVLNPFYVQFKIYDTFQTP